MNSVNRRSVDTLNAAQNPPLEHLSSLRLERCGKDSKGRQIYRIASSPHGYRAYREGGQIKWEASGSVNASELEEVIRFSIDKKRSLLINAGTHGSRS